MAWQLHFLCDDHLRVCDQREQGWSHTGPPGAVLRLPTGGSGRQVRWAGLFRGLPAVDGPAGTWDLKENEQKARGFLCNHQMCLQPVPSFHHLSFNQSIHPAMPESHLYLTFHHFDSRICQFLPGC